MIRPDGSLGRVMRSIMLGPVSEIPSRREARKLLEARLRPLNEGRLRPQATVTFGQFVEEQWKPAVLPLLKPSSVRYYTLLIKRHILPVFEHDRLCDIHRAEVQAFLVEKRRVGCSSSHVHGLRTVLSKVLQTAVEWGYLESNPVRGIRLAGYEPVRQRLMLSLPDFRRLLAVLREPCRTIVVLLVLTGLRIGELLALRWKNVDLRLGAVQVRETVSARGVFGTAKTRSSRRNVPLSAPACDALTLHQSRCIHTQPDDLVFSTRNRTPLNYVHLLVRVLHPACERLKLPKIGWHGLRHMHATLLGEVGESLRTAQALLGHSDLQTTLNVYTHPIPESQRRAVDKIAGILFPNVPKSEETERLIH
ncbi:MAG: tyrosine-type recombinase/integrase [Anaerolineae bacterium]|nr:tyrosine-type recombinase/integrase [Anaerolineae bacterium]